MQLTLKSHSANGICKNVPLGEISETLSQLILDPALAYEWGIDAAQAKPIQGADLKTISHTFDLQLQSNKPKLVTRKATKSDAHETRRDRGASEVLVVLCRLLLPASHCCVFAKASKYTLF